MKHLVAILLLSGCTPQSEPGINLNDWTEQTKSSKLHMPRDTYDVVVFYNGDRPNDTIINTVYKHYPTDKDIQPDYLSNIPTFKAPDNEHARLYLNVKKVAVIKATVSQNNVEYIKAMMEEQDSIKKMEGK